MAFKTKKGAVLGLVRGDNKYDSIKLYDKRAFQASNGLGIKIETTAEAETLAGAMEPFLDGVINFYSCQVGSAKDEAKIPTQDDHGDSATKVFTVKFAETSKTCVLPIPAVLNTKNSRDGSSFKSSKL